MPIRTPYRRGLVYPTPRAAIAYPTSGVIAHWNDSFHTNSTGVEALGGDVVKTVKDLSGNGNDLAQAGVTTLMPTQSIRSLNGRAGLLFAGGQYMTRAWVALSQPVTVHLVLKLTDDSKTNYIFDSASGNRFALWAGTSWGTYPTTGSINQYGAGPSNNGTLQFPHKNIPYVITCRYDGANSYFMMNRVVYGRGTLNPYTMAGIILGINQAITAGLYGIFAFYEGAVYQGQSAADELQWQDAAAYYWGLNIAAPTIATTSLLPASGGYPQGLTHYVTGCALDISGPIRLPANAGPTAGSQPIQLFPTLEKLGATGDGRICCVISANADSSSGNTIGQYCLSSDGGLTWPTSIYTSGTNNPPQGYCPVRVELPANAGSLFLPKYTANPGSIQDVSILTGGAGYSGTYTVGFSGGGGGGAGAVATAQFLAGALVAINFSNRGAGYTSAPAMTLTGTAPTTAATWTVNVDTVHSTGRGNIIAPGATALTNQQCTFTGFPLPLGTISAAWGGIVINGRAIMRLDGTTYMAVAYVQYSGVTHYKNIVMTSTNGFDWTYLATIGDNTLGSEGSTESVIIRRADNSLLCYWRVSSLVNYYYATSTAASDGAVWSTPVQGAKEFSVYPALLLQGGKMFLSSGRVGNRLAVDNTGTGLDSSWQDVDMVAHHNATMQGDSILSDPLESRNYGIYQVGTTGYTNLLALDSTHFLMVYDHDLDYEIYVVRVGAR
jgi:hypothetical protein